MGGVSIIVHIDTSAVGKRPHRHIRDTAAFPLDRELMGTQWENIISHLALIYESPYREAQQGSSRHTRAEADDDKGRTRK